MKQKQFDAEITDCVAKHNNEPRMGRALSLFIAALALLDYEAPQGISEDDFAAASRIAYRRMRKALRSGASA